MIKTENISLFLFLCFQPGYKNPCPEVNWEDKDFLVMVTEKPLQSKFSSDGQQFCLERPNTTEPSVIECSNPKDKNWNETSLRMRTNVVPEAYHVRLETDIVQRKYNRIHKYRGLSDQSYEADCSTY